MFRWDRFPDYCCGEFRYKKVIKGVDMFSAMSREHAPYTFILPTAEFCKQHTSWQGTDGEIKNVKTCTL